MSADDDRIEVHGEEKTREELEREAERTRARLLETLDVLDRRRHDLLDVRKQVEDHFAPVASAIAIAVLFLGGAIGVAIHDAIDRRRHKGRARVRALARLWQHPDRALRVEEKSFAGELGRKVLMTALSVVATQVTSHFVKQALALELGEAHEGDHAPHERTLPKLARLAEEALRPRAS